MRRLLAEAAAELTARGRVPQREKHRAGHHGRDAGGRPVPRPARRRGRFLQHRQQRPAAVLPGRRPRQRRRGGSLRSAAIPPSCACSPRRPPQARAARRWLGLCGEMAGDSRSPAAAGRPGPRRAQHGRRPHPGGQGPPAPAGRRRLPRTAAARPCAAPTPAKWANCCASSTAAAPPPRSTAPDLIAAGRGQPHRRRGHQGALRPAGARRPGGRRRGALEEAVWKRERTYRHRPGARLRHPPRQSRPRCAPPRSPSCARAARSPGAAEDAAARARRPADRRPRRRPGAGAPASSSPACRGG